MHSIFRRRFVARASATGALVTLTPLRLVVAQPAAAPATTGKPRPAIDRSLIPDKGPRLDSTLVFEFVYFAHFNLDVIRDMLDETPTLLNAAWDWGGGD